MKLTRTATHRHGSGFSMVELMVVLAIALSAMIVALPSIAEALAQSRIRGAMSELSGIAQACRIQAVKQNKVKRLRIATINGRVTAYVQDETTPASDPPATSDTQIVLPMGLSMFTTPSGEGSPSQLTSEIMWGSGADPETGKDTHFNSRGMPCSPDAGNCKSNLTPGFIYYFSLPRSLGGTAWAAIGVSPAGRVRAWYWNGSAWSY